MTFRDMLAEIAIDIDRYRGKKKRSSLAILIAEQGAQASVVYRFGHWVYSSAQHSAPVKLILRAIFVVLQRMIDILTGISLHASTKIGAGLKIPHYGGIVVGKDIVIGRHCTISQGVTIGIAGRGERRGSPIIGDRVYIAPGAKIFGAITIGNDVAIGANAVVTKSVPDRAVVAGIPARVISLKGSFEFVEYANMEQDIMRKESLAARDQAAQRDEIVDEITG